MGVRVDLIDKSVYGTAATEIKQKMANDQPILNERDKFLLSDKETLPLLQQPKLSRLQSQQSKPEVVKTQPDLFDDEFEDDIELAVYSGTGPQGGEKGRKMAIEQIERTFQRVQKFQIGSSKPGFP